VALLAVCEHGAHLDPADEADEPAHRRGGWVSDEGLKFVFRAMMVVWAVLAVVSVRYTSQDGAGFVAAGIQTAHGDVDVVYAGHADRFAITDGRTKALICDASDPATPCHSYARYLSTPAALPLLVPFGLGSLDLGLFLWRLPIAASLIWGMVLLRDRVEKVVHGPALMTASAVLLTPGMHFLVVMGQTSSSMFLAVAIGVTGAAAGGVRRAGAIASTTVAIVTKILPVLTLVPLFLLGARRTALVTVAVVAALALGVTALGGVDIWSDYAHLTAAVADTTESTHLSARLTRWVPLPALLLVVGGFALALWARRRELAADVVYAGAWLAAISVTPFLWNHYLWVCFAALVITYAEHATKPALFAAGGFALGSALLHLQGSPEGVPLYRVAVVVVTAGVLLHAAYAGVTRSATRALPSTGP
jgi:hypothetical protein